MDRCKYNKFVGCNAKVKERCNICKVYVVYQQGRTDAIKEFQKWYTDLINNPPSAIVPYSVIFDKLEQMKREAYK